MCQCYRGVFGILVWTHQGQRPMDLAASETSGVYPAHVLCSDDPGHKDTTLPSRGYDLERLLSSILAANRP